MKIPLPADLVGERVDQGTYTVTRAKILAYAASVGDTDTLAGTGDVAPPTFVLSMRRGMVPTVALPPGVVSVFGGIDLVFHDVLRADTTYRMSAQISDIYEKSGRTGSLTVIVRTAVIATEDGTPVIEVEERQIVRPVPPAKDPTEAHP